jgi:hypothetical protein
LHGPIWPYNGGTNGRVVGPDRTFTTLASEASGRRAVLLEGQGDYVEFTLSAPANALTVRYAVPDGPEGKPVDAKLAIIGEVTERDDHKLLAGIGGALGGFNSVRPPPPCFRVGEIT